MKMAAIVLLMLGGAVTAGGVLLGVLQAPEGEALNWAFFAAGIAVGTTIELAGVFLLLAERKRQEGG